MRGTITQGVGLRWTEHLFFCSGACLLAEGHSDHCYNIFGKLRIHVRGEVDNGCATQTKERRVE